MDTLVVIPARGGSKGVPGKNIKLLNGKPLIYYTIEAAREVFSDENICISTDDVKIKECVEKSGLIVPFIRPLRLAKDNSGTYEVLLHALDHYEKKGFFPNKLVLLQPTSPFRKAKHIKEALAQYDSNCEIVLSVKTTKSNPYYVLMEQNKDGWLVQSKKADFIRRQDCPDVFEVNGAIQIINVSALKKKHLNHLLKVKKYLMDEFSSHDIDTMLDWTVAENIISNQ